jgi:hypothetical protein
MLSSNRDDSFIKLPKTSSVFLPRELRNLRVFVSFSSKNKNNNGFVLVGSNSFSFDYTPVVYFPVCCCILHCFSWLLAFRLTKIFAY